jgi:HNH endonuclease
MTTISLALRQLVSERAQAKCEYCRLHQDFSIYSHEIDHIIAQKHGGRTVSENLALACLVCNRHKGSDLTTIDPMTQEITPLFHPRSHTWLEHFVLEDSAIVGITQLGRATAFLLMFNNPTRLLQRRALMTQGLYP